MMFELKRLSADALPRALEKANRYRLLNEPGEAASICLDVLEVDRDDQEALATLLLSLTDQFDEDGGSAIREARAVLDRLVDPYERAYYAGIIDERRAKAHLRHHALGSGPRAYEWLRDAMASYERAEAIRPPGNDDALLRWNACARLLMRDPHLAPEIEGPREPLFLE